MSKASKISNAITTLYEEVLMHKSKSVCLTSSTAKEGTTTIATALATAASLQQKVLYCDFTNYATSLSKKLHKEFLVTKGTPVEQIYTNIYSLEKYHFDLMPLPTPLIPILMHEGFLKELLQELNQQYDLIIIDTNGFHRYKGSSLPTGIVCSAVESTVLVVLSGEVSEPEVQQTAVSIVEGGGRLIGIVMNDVHYPKLMDELIRTTHLLDKYKPVWAEKIRKWIRKSMILNTEN